MTVIYSVDVSSRNNIKTLLIRFGFYKEAINKDEWCDKVIDGLLKINHDLTFGFNELRVKNLLEIIGTSFVSSNPVGEALKTVRYSPLAKKPLLYDLNRNIHEGFIKVYLKESIKISDDSKAPPKNWDDTYKEMYMAINSNRQNDSQTGYINHFVNGYSGRYPFGKEETNMNTSNTYKVMTDSDMQELHILRCKTALYDLGIRKIIFNDNATIVFWVYGTKTVVKCCEMDTYSREAAIAIAIMKHKVGEDYYHYVMDTLLGKKGDHFTYNTVSRATRSIDIIDMNKEEK